MVIVGGGPTGMMLGAELALAGVEALILERRPNQQLDGSRAGGLHSRAIELLDQRGAADRFLAEGDRVQITWLGDRADPGLDDTLAMWLEAAVAT